MTIMGHREVRPIAAGWQHPQDGEYPDGRPRYRPLFSRENLRFTLEWNAEHPDSEDAREPVDLADYMPEIPEGTPFEYVLYETTSEGTPVSPAFGTLEDLAAWCETGATAFARIRWTREEWLASFLAGATGRDSLAVIGGGGITTLNRTTGEPS